MKSEFDLRPDKINERLDTTKKMIGHAKSLHSPRLTFSFYGHDMGAVPFVSSRTIDLKAQHLAAILTSLAFTVKTALKDDRSFLEYHMQGRRYSTLPIETQNYLCIRYLDLFSQIS